MTLGTPAQEASSERQGTSPFKVQGFFDDLEKQLQKKDEELEARLAGMPVEQADRIRSAWHKKVEGTMQQALGDTMKDMERVLKSKDSAKDGHPAA